MLNVLFIDVVQDCGISGNQRYFNRRSRSTGLPSKRQVTLIEREQIAEHATALSLETIPPGTVRSNVETAGISLVQLVGSKVRVGDAILLISEPRTPCEKMDAICPGLRQRMENNRQGVLAQVVKSGRIAIGDMVTPFADDSAPTLERPL